MLTQSLSQAELDDRFHHGIFIADDVIETTLRKYFEEDDDEDSKAFCQEIIDTLQEAVGAAEEDFLGPERYAALLARLDARSKPPSGTQ